eukprot:2682628-Rhodomonas_salina.1
MTAAIRCNTTIASPAAIDVRHTGTGTRVGQPGTRAGQTPHARVSARAFGAGYAQGKVGYTPGSARLPCIMTSCPTILVWQHRICAAPSSP